MMRVQLLLVGAMCCHHVGATPALGNVHRVRSLVKLTLYQDDRCTVPVSSDDTVGLGRFTPVGKCLCSNPGSGTGSMIKVNATHVSYIAFDSPCGFDEPPTCAGEPGESLMTLKLNACDLYAGAYNVYTELTDEVPAGKIATAQYSGRDCAGIVDVWTVYDHGKCLPTSDGSGFLQMDCSGPKGARAYSLYADDQCEGAPIIPGLACPDCECRDDATTPLRETCTPPAATAKGWPWTQFALW